MVGNDEVRTENRDVLRTGIERVDDPRREAQTNFVPLDLIDFLEIGDVADATVRDEYMIVDHTCHGQPAVDVLEEVRQSSGMPFVFMEDFLHKSVPRRRDELVQPERLHGLFSL